MLTDLTCKEFLAELASESPAPGGGSVAALSGTLGAALVDMVGKLSVGREQFKAHEGEVRAAMEEAAKLTGQLLSYVDQDTEAFNQVIVAFKLPRDSEELKKARLDAIQQAAKGAALLPLEVASSCYEVLKLCKCVAIEGNPNALSDAGVGALMAFAGLQGALFNVEINLASIKDKQFVTDRKEKVRILGEQGALMRDEVIGFVRERLSD